MDDAVERQVRAYNAHDIDAFVACYAEDVVVEDADGNVIMAGRNEKHQSKSELGAGPAMTFTPSPSIG